MIGDMYSFGQGVPVDANRGAGYWLQAHDGNNADALCNLAHLHHQGVTLPRDIPKMLEFYERAVAMEHAGAEHNLACLYRDGTCVEQDIPRALALFESAAAKNHPGAILGIGGLYDTGMGTSEIVKCPRLIGRYFSCSSSPLHLLPMLLT